MKRSIDFIQQDRARIEAKVLPPSLSALFDEAAACHCDRPFWIDVDRDGVVYTYREFQARIWQYASALQRAGAGRGRHVAVVMHNSPELGAIWLALSRLGAVAIGINVGLTASELDFVLNSSEAELLIADRDAIPSGFGDETGPSTRLPMIIRGGILVGTERGWADVMDGVGIQTAPCHVEPDELATMLFTSGSTGLPKPCMLPHRWHTMMGWVRSQQGPPVERVLIETPLYYMGGQWRFAMAMYLGAAVCVARRPTLSHYLDRLLSFNIGFCSVSELTAKLPADPRYRALRLGWACSSGLPKELHQEIERRLGAPVREIYGSTELGSAIVMPAGVEDMVGSGSCGMPSAWRICKIVSEYGQEVAQGESGELLVRGPGTIQAYYGRPEANADSFRDGWFRTGDLFVRDREGFYYWKGRIKNIIRRSNQNISADEVEAVARALPGVAEAAVIPVPDPYRGEEVKLYVSLSPGRSIENIPPGRLIAHCRESLAAFKVPRYVEYVDEFPRTASNKISKQALKAAKANLRNASYDVQDAIWR